MGQKTKTTDCNGLWLNYTLSEILTERQKRAANDIFENNRANRKRAKESGQEFRRESAERYLCLPTGKDIEKAGRRELDDIIDELNSDHKRCQTAVRVGMALSEWHGLDSKDGEGWNKDYLDVIKDMEKAYAERLRDVMEARYFPVRT